MKKSGTAILVGVMGSVIYLFSLPFVAFLLNAFPQLTVCNKVIDAFYGPAIFLADHCDFVARILILEIDILGIPVGD